MSGGLGGWLVKAVYAGSQDVTDSGVEVRGAQRLTGIQIVLTNQVSEISAR